MTQTNDDDMLTPEEVETLNRLTAKQIRKHQRESPLQILPQTCTTVGALTSLNLRTIQTIGLLDRALSELKVLAQDPLLDKADTQTVKHHAEDCVGLGNRVLEILRENELLSSLPTLGKNDHTS